MQCWISSFQLQVPRPPAASRRWTEACKWCAAFPGFWWTDRVLLLISPNPLRLLALTRPRRRAALALHTRMLLLLVISLQHMNPARTQRGLILVEQRVEIGRGRGRSGTVAGGLTAHKWQMVAEVARARGGCRWWCWWIGRAGWHGWCLVRLVCGHLGYTGRYEMVWR